MTNRFLGLNLQPDIRRLYVSHFLLASFVAIMLSSFLPQMQAFFLTEFLAQPIERHGRVSGVLIARQSPKQSRGAIIGTFNLSGAVGILVASVAGGWLFDHWREPGPFVAFGVLAFGMMVAAVVLNRKPSANVIAAA